MSDPMSTLSPEKLNSHSNNLNSAEDDVDMAWHDPPSSPFVSHIEADDQENIAPANTVATTPTKPLLSLDENAPQSAFKISSPAKKGGVKKRTSPVKMSPTKQLLDGVEDLGLGGSTGSRPGSKRSSPVKQITAQRPESATSNHSRTHSQASPSRTSRTASTESARRAPESPCNTTPERVPSPAKHPSSSHTEPTLRDNEGLTVAMKILEETRHENHESFTTYHGLAESPDLDGMGMDNTDFNPDGPDFTSLDMDDTCFSTFSEMPGIDMTKFAVLRKSPTRNGLLDPATPRARTQMTPSTVRRTERTPSPTPRRSRKENDTTNLLLDFTAQIEAYSASRHHSPSRGRTSAIKSSTEPNLLSYIQNQRSPAKGSSFVPSTPSQNRQGLLNLLDFELPPPPTPRSVPTVTIRELESLKSTFQSQISSLSASLSGKEAQVESLVKAIADAERRVGEAQETVRDERSARDYAEAQMVDWKKKGEEVQRLLQDVQSELARNDTEREALLSRLSEFEKRAEDAEARASDLETRLIEAESKNVDMTTFINPDEPEENRKIYSEAECQAAIAEKVNEVARDLHSAYKAKHEKKIKALKDNYQRKADERCKELRVQIIRLERQVEEAEKKRDETFSKVLPPASASKTDGKCDRCGQKDSSPSAEDVKRLEAQKSQIEGLKARLAGLESELSSLHKSHDTLVQELEAERVEKGELVAAAEQMLSLCGEKMEAMQQEEMRKSQPPPASEPGMRSSTRPPSAMGDKTGIAKPSGLRAPGGFGFQAQRGDLGRSMSGGKSRIMSNIERMGGGRTQE